MSCQTCDFPTATRRRWSDRAGPPFPSVRPWVRRRPRTSPDPVLAQNIADDRRLAGPTGADDRDDQRLLQAQQPKHRFHVLSLKLYHVIEDTS